MPKLDLRTGLGAIALALVASAAQPAMAGCINQVPAMTSNTTPSGTVSTSGIFGAGYEAWRAFDASNTSLWLSETFETPAWIEYAFPTARRVSRYSLTYANGSILTRAPKDWSLLGWTGSSWITLDTRTNQTGWAGLETRSYTIASPGTYLRYQLVVTDDNDSRAGVVVLSLGRIALEDCTCDDPTSQVPTMTGYSAPSGLVSTSGVYSTSYPAWYAFDASETSQWISEVFESPAWLEYQWPANRTITSYALVFQNGSLPSRAPKDWVLQGWNGSAWVTLDSRSEQTDWLGSEMRAFVVASPGSYARYRLTFTDDNDVRSGVVVISLGHVSLFGCAF